LIIWRAQKLQIVKEIQSLTIFVCLRGKGEQGIILKELWMQKYASVMQVIDIHQEN